EEVSSGDTGHAEVVQVTYDPQKISYAELLEVFWNTHDPTTADRQGNDVGSQYRSVIFYHTDQQKRLAQESKEKLGQLSKYKAPIVTQILPFKNFFKGEGYHQDYYEKNTGAPYCQVVIQPKIEKLEKQFKEKLRDK
ncbi:MAG: peptide-methionine (S)-S-oxide reductase MsrA, partial [Candidatus Portnoybacteria bacterium]|nr:peptide-methionine (S)-S-oxide reductase MsrA [Candidatus Portnoybacteria bacterium]